jgi:Holliday junction resolvasome RuvABC endonuclease subunit
MSLKILALDIATKTGWATQTTSGTWDLKPQSGESVGMRVIRFKAKLREIIEVERPDVVIYERPAGRSIRAIQTQSEMIGVLIDYCHTLNIEYASVSPAEIKKHATNRGNCSKGDMVAAAKAKWPLTEIVDDNCADALWLLDLAKSRLI